MAYQSIGIIKKSPPSPDEIRQAVEEVLSRPVFAPKDPKNDGLLDDFSKIIGDFFRELFDSFASIFELGSQLREQSPFVFWALVGGLSLLVCVLFFRLSVVLIKAIRARRFDASFGVEHFSVKVSTPEQLEEEAATAGQAGDFILALRLLFMAAVMRLEKASDNFYKPALTNTEYLKRFRKTAAEEPLTILADMINKWYAGDACDKHLYEQGVLAHKRLADLAGRQG